MTCDTATKMKRGVRSATPNKLSCKLFLSTILLRPDLIPNLCMEQFFFHPLLRPFLFSPMKDVTLRTRFSHDPMSLCMEELSYASNLPPQRILLFSKHTPKLMPRAFLGVVWFLNTELQLALKLHTESKESSLWLTVVSIPLFLQAVLSTIAFGKQKIVYFRECVVLNL